MDNVSHLNLSDSSQIKGRISTDSQDQYTRPALYSDSQKASGIFSWIGGKLGITALIRSAKTQAAFKQGYKNTVEAIKDQYGESVAEAFKLQFSNRYQSGSPLTVGSVKRFLLKQQESNSAIRLETNSVLMAVKYGGEKAALFQTAFLSFGNVQYKASGAARVDYQNLPPQEQTVTIISGPIKSLTEMGFVIMENGNRSDGLMPEGAARIFGREEKKVLSEELREEFKREKNKSIESSTSPTIERTTVKINGISFSFTVSAGAKERLEDLKSEIKKLSPQLSDEAVTDLLHLMSKDLFVSGTPPGCDVKTGYALSQQLMLPNENTIIQISLTEDNKINLDYDSGKGYMASIDIPKRNRNPTNPKDPGDMATLSLNVVPGDSGYPDDPIQIDVSNPPKGIPTFIRENKYTYTYTPPLDNNPSSVEVTDSRQIYYPASQIEGLSEESRAAISSTMNKTINDKDKWASEYQWSDGKGPKLATQFVEDLDRVGFNISEKGKTTPLYNESANDDTKKDPNKLVAAEKFVAFVGDSNKAFLISQKANQQVAFNGGLLEDKMKKYNSLLQLSPHGAGTIATVTGGTSKKMTFSKTSEGSIMLHVRLHQQAGMFRLDNQPDASDIELDSTRSYVDLDYNIIFNFDDQNRLTLDLSPIRRSYNLEPKQAE